MQLHATLASLLHHIAPYRVTVIYGNENDYSLVESNFPGVTFLRDRVFDETVRSVILGTSEDHLLFAIDDIAYVRGVDMNCVGEALANPELLGFSLSIVITFSS